MFNLKYYQIYESYINELLRNENTNEVDWLNNLVTKKDYEELLRPVLNIINNNPHASLTTLRLLLFEQSGIKELIDNFVKSTQITPGIILDFGTINTRDTVLCGLSQEYTIQNGIFVRDEKPLEQDTIFDLASTSKLFTSIAITKLHEDRIIDVFDPVIKYIPECKNIGKTTIYDLLKFRVKIVTDKRIDSTKNIEEAKSILFTAHPTEMKPLENAYTDIGAMLLRFVVERTTKMPFQEVINEIIIKKSNMTDTYLNVPEEKLSRVANENYSTIITKDGTDITKQNNIPGTPHDSKAISIGHESGIAPGHAGWFSTKDDMIKLGESLIDETILTKKSLESISQTATAFKDEDKTTRNYGSLVYLKQLESDYLSVNQYLSGKSFMSPGFAGTTLVIDPLNKITLFIGASRLHNRIYQIHPDQKANIIIDEHNKKTFKLKNGEEKIVCADYTKAKEVMVSLAIRLSLQYQLLEKLFPQNKKMHLVRELN